MAPLTKGWVRKICFSPRFDIGDPSFIFKDKRTTPPHQKRIKSLPEMELVAVD
jgi:hypothetical protein